MWAQQCELTLSKAEQLPWPLNVPSANNIGHLPGGVESLPTGHGVNAERLPTREPTV